MDIEETVNKNEKRKRRKALLQLIQAVLSGEIDSTKMPVDELLRLHTGPTREYISPRDRNHNNYRYMEIGEMMAGTPNEK